jgi:dephospho-CoA kinase
MLRVGLTGGLGAGKSTVARMFAARGAVVLESDAIGRELMEPGHAVYQAIVAHFGPSVVMPSGALDRKALARIAFSEGKVEELNAIVHPAVIAVQEERMRPMAADAVVMVESALIFETKYSGSAGWRERFDRMVLVSAPEALKIERFLERAGATAETRAALEAEARRRLAVQMPDEAKAAFSDYVLVNDGDRAGLEAQVEHVWQELARTAAG